MVMTSLLVLPVIHHDTCSSHYQVWIEEAVNLAHRCHLGRYQIIVSWKDFPEAFGIATVMIKKITRFYDIYSKVMI